MHELIICPILPLKVPSSTRPNEVVAKVEGLCSPGRGIFSSEKPFDAMLYRKRTFLSLKTNVDMSGIDAGLELGI